MNMDLYRWTPAMNPMREMKPRQSARKARLCWWSLRTRLVTATLSSWRSASSIGCSIFTSTRASSASASFLSSLTAVSGLVTIVMVEC